MSPLSRAPNAPSPWSLPVANLRTWIVTPVAMLATIPALARAGGPAAGDPAIPSIEELVAMRRLQAVQIAPDGSRVAVIIEQPNDADHSKDPTPTGLWIV